MTGAFFVLKNGSTTLALRDSYDTNDVGVVTDGGIADQESCAKLDGTREVSIKHGDTDVGG